MDDPDGHRISRVCLRKIAMWKYGIVLLGAIGFSSASLAQNGPRPPGLFKPQDQIETELEQSTPALGIVAGQTSQIIVHEGGQIVVRRRQSGPNNASIHNELTEIYYIVEGTGTFVTGGAITDPENRTMGITGGTAQRVGPGDFIILPPGTPHWFSEINGAITYTETRFNTGR
jgi:mannose-6-phosphate isomerase-like protein (cupin superfamily)